MHPLPDVSKCIARKYCGGGFGGYAVYVFESKGDRDAAVEEEGGVMRGVEPVCWSR